MGVEQYQGVRTYFLCHHLIQDLFIDEETGQRMETKVAVHRNPATFSRVFLSSFHFPIYTSYLSMGRHQLCHGCSVILDQFRNLRRCLRSHCLYFVSLYSLSPFTCLFCCSRYMQELPDNSNQPWFPIIKDKPNATISLHDCEYPRISLLTQLPLTPNSSLWWS